MFKTASLCNPGWPPSPQLAWCCDYKCIKCWSLLESDPEIPAITNASNDSKREARGLLENVNGYSVSALFTVWFEIAWGRFCHVGDGDGMEKRQWMMSQGHPWFLLYWNLILYRGYIYLFICIYIYLYSLTRTTHSYTHSYTHTQGLW